MEQGLTNRMEQGYSQPNGPGAGAGAISLGDDNRRDAWWNIPWRAFNLFDPPDRYALIRRVGAYIAVFFRGLITFAQLFSYAWERHSTVAGFLFLVALGLLGFVFVVCGLAIIVEAKGRRVVFGLALVSVFFPFLFLLFPSVLRRSRLLVGLLYDASKCTPASMTDTRDLLGPPAF